MKILVVGINHKTAPIEIREKFYCSTTTQELLLSELRFNPSIAEALVLSTCNRTEIYSYALNPQEDAQVLIRNLFDIKGLSYTKSLRKHFYVYFNEDAVTHFLKVATGLGSLVLGERQILGQVKEAVRLAQKKATLGKYLNILSNIAIRTGKMAHTQTEISFGGCSLSWAAVMMAEKILGSFTGRSSLIIGAGKMGELALTQMKKKGLNEIYIMNRTQSCALELAQRCNGAAVSFGDIKEILSKVDVCICSVGAPHYILEKSTVEKAMALRNHERLILIDISMPRNIDPQVSHLKDVLLFYLDDLDKVVGETMRKRQEAVIKVERIILNKTSEFYKKIRKIQILQSSDYFETKTISISEVKSSP